MPKLARACQAVLVAAGLAAATGSTLAEEPAAVTDDKYAWLEDVTGDKPLEWVKAQNAKAEAEIAATPEFSSSKPRSGPCSIPMPRSPAWRRSATYYYNFWKDKHHERGVWRRTTLEEYRKPQPQWETVIDLDALNAPKACRTTASGSGTAPIAASPTTPAAWSRCRAAAPMPTSPASSTWPASNGCRTDSSVPKPRAGWAGRTPTRSTSTPISAPAA